MVAIITSIGEPTTELCTWSLDRNGFEVHLVQSEDTTLHTKLEYIYNNFDQDFLRVDADVIVNKNCNPRDIEDSLKDTIIWWQQYTCWDWWKQDVSYGGIQFIRRQALPALRANISRFKDAERPESQMYRLDEFNSPRRCVSNHQILGLNGYGQTDINRVKDTKRRRNQYHNYDWQLVEKLNNLRES